MKELKDIRELQQKARDKQIIEAQLAKSIYEVFDKGQALKKLQDMAGVILTRMGRGDPTPFKDAVNEEANLRVWNKVNKIQFDFIRMSNVIHRVKFDATDCADLIRLAGAWVESGGLANPAFSGTGDTDWQQNQPMGATVKEAYRSGVGSGSNKSKVENVWSDGKGRFQNVAGKKRDRGAGWRIEGHVLPYMRDQQGFSGMAGLMVKGAKFSKRLQGNSNILKLDNLFGLLKGCDVSGTTTDTVYALEIFGAEVGLTAGYYLLPLGTIVHNMHHTLIEVAGALTLTKAIDYHIGFYSSLAPVATRGLANELSALTGILNDAEMKMSNQNLHFLNYYWNDKLAGAYLMERGDLERFKSSNLSHSTTMMDKVCHTIGPFPTKMEVKVLIERNMPGATFS